MGGTTCTRSHTSTASLPPWSCTGSCMPSSLRQSSVELRPLCSRHMRRCCMQQLSATTSRSTARRRRRERPPHVQDGTWRRNMHDHLLSRHCIVKPGNRFDRSEASWERRSRDVWRMYSGDGHQVPWCRCYTQASLKLAKTSPETAKRARTPFWHCRGACSPTSQTANTGDTHFNTIKPVLSYLLPLSSTDPAT